MSDGWVERAMGRRAVRVLALVALLATAAAVRVPGIGDSLYLHEAVHARALARPPSLAAFRSYPLYLRPALFSLATQALAHLLGYTEVALRLIPLLAALAFIVVLALLLGRLVRSRAVAAFGVGLALLNVWLTDHAKQLKPYAVDVLLCGVVVLLAESYLRDRARRTRALLCAVAPLAALSSHPAAFYLPAALVMVAVLDARARDFRGVVWAAGAALAAGGLTLLQYLASASHVPRNQFWYWAGRFYDHGPLSALGRHAAEIAWGPALTARYSLRPDGLSAPLALMIALVLLGVAALAIERRGWLLAVLVTPLVLPVGASLLGKWPYGLTRVSLYTLALTVPLACLGVDFVVSRLRYRAAAAFVMAGLVALYTPLSFGRYATTSRTTLVKPLLGAIAHYDAAATGRDESFVALGNDVEHIFRYYVDVYPGRADMRAFFRRLERHHRVFFAHREGAKLYTRFVDGLLAVGRPVWVVMTKWDDGGRAALSRLSRRRDVRVVVALDRERAQLRLFRRVAPAAATGRPARAP